MWRIAYLFIFVQFGKGTLNHISLGPLPFNVTSPRRTDGTYPPNINHSWILTVSLPYHIQATFITFQLSPTCCDSLIIFERSRPIYNFGGQHTFCTPIIFEAPAISIRFQSDADDL